MEKRSLILLEPVYRTGKMGRREGSRAGTSHTFEAVKEAFDWEDDKRPEIPANECIIYKIHPRGFQNMLLLKVKAGGGEHLERSQIRSLI